jgi:hypothetical protein
MPKLGFVVNLRNLTIDPVFRRRLNPSGYLAAPAALTALLRKAAGTIARDGRLLVADNGLFDDIGAITKALAADSGEVRHRLDALDGRLGRPLTAGDLDAKTARLVAALADEAGARADGLAPGYTLADRLSLNPTAAIGNEDITGAMWIRLGVDAVLPKVRSRELRRRNRAVACAAAHDRQDVPKRVNYLPVASAFDYDTAFDAGREFASAGLTGAACGFGAYMADDRSTDTIVIRGRIRKLPGLLPQRYLRTALAARGFWDGWHAETGGAPKAFHFLGLGAPIMMPIVALAARATPVLTFDATSPIRDAGEGTIYVSRPAYLKIRAWKVAERLAGDPKARWNCPCPFCRAFVRDHPFDYADGHAWRKAHPRKVVTAVDLRGQAALAKAYPLLAQAGSRDPLRDLVEMARVGHNHWALDEICAAASRARNLDAHVAGIVAAYAEESRGTQFIAAVKLALDIARGGLP